MRRFLAVRLSCLFGCSGGRLQPTFGAGRPVFTVTGVCCFRRVHDHAEQRNFRHEYYFSARFHVRPRPGFKLRNAEVYLKLESEMPTGPFKVRGALYVLHAEMTRRQVTEVVASSTRNLGAAVAYAAKLLNLPAKIFSAC